MSKLERCDACMGKKKILGLGSIMKDCPECRGIGWIDVPEMPKGNNLASVGGSMDRDEFNEMIKPKKKPGRKPKMVNKEIPLQV